MKAQIRKRFYVHAIEVYAKETTTCTWYVKFMRRSSDRERWIVLSTFQAAKRQKQYVLHSRVCLVREIVDATAEQPNTTWIGTVFWICRNNRPNPAIMASKTKKEEKNEKEIEVIDRFDYESENVQNTVNNNNLNNNCMGHVT